jgi:hypothetical protein
MSDPSDDFCVDLLDPEEKQDATQRIVALIIKTALSAGAETIEFSLTEPSSRTGFRIRYSRKSVYSEMAPSPSHFFGPLVVVLCYHASVPYRAAGRVEGALRTRRPDSSWLLSSDDLKQKVLLTKT